MAVPHGLISSVHRWMSRLINATMRHKDHTSYCLRKDKHGKLYCRFRFPLQPREENSRVHFYCERVERGVRWRLYLPLNDPLRNPVNKWQVLAHRSNNDFQPLIDHFCALEYMTKYASKAEKGSKSLDMLLAAKPLHT